MIEEQFPENSFIAGWYISETVCDDVIKLFEDNRNLAQQGTIAWKGEASIKKDVKDSLDLSIPPSNNNTAMVSYRLELQKVLDNYLEKYPQANAVDKFDVVSNYNIQYYVPGAGFKTWHCERSNIRNSKRHLVFMTYLNDVRNGGTEFKHQGIKTEAKKGLTIIWPTDWTHTHRGIISSEDEKYIATGWFSYIDNQTYD